MASGLVAARSPALDHRRPGRPHDEPALRLGREADRSSFQPRLVLSGVDGVVRILQSGATAAVPSMPEASDKILPGYATVRTVAKAPSSNEATLASNDAKRTLDGILERYANGDDTAFHELYREGAPRVRGFLLRMSSDPMLADDLTQEAFLRIHLARGSFLAGAAALPWMLAIARNVFLDHMRRERVRRTARERAAEGAPAGAAEAPPDTRGDEVLAAQELFGVVREALDRMPLLQREAFVLLRFEGLSVSEAAGALGATEGAVKVRAFRAYEVLRAALDHHQTNRARQK